ncbi:MAG: redoxin domain-containing protein [Bacteroidetes bacterium]|nr:redoxin domain-containing protein [Bacteroidota bacterium]MBS1686738.1 redoxin domain-containing protein [Bacteroidota bacterium]
MRKAFVICWLLLLLAAICTIFWHQEWKYSLPTPVPIGYRAVQPGQHISLEGKLISDAGKPLFIHFFNPECPCSRFNAPHFNALVRKYGDKINFAVVLINTTKLHDPQEVRAKYDFAVPVLTDSSIAIACGVYSTPQAALINADGTLYYRGNYNRTRYCTDTRSDYARMALDSMLLHIAHPTFNQFALTAYGCQLPYCTR